MSKNLRIDDMANAIMKGLQEYAEVTNDEMKKAVRKTATSVKKEIQANAPKDRGDYAKSWTTTKVDESSHRLIVKVHSKKHYRLAHLLENGHVLRQGGRTKAYPHIAPAEEHGEKMFEELLEKAIKG